MRAFYINAIPETHKCVVAAQTGCTSDKIASIVVDDESLVLQCDDYVLHIHKDEKGEYIIDSNCTDELFNTMSASILANDNFKIKNNIENLILDMNCEIASYILSVLVYDINIFLRCNKESI
jgi:hypothetical protein